MNKEKVYLGGNVWVKTTGDGRLVFSYEEKCAQCELQHTSHVPLVLLPDQFAALLEYLEVERVGKKEGE